MHKIVKCSCGAIIMQCRCITPGKTVEIVKDGCKNCKEGGENGKT